MDREEEISSPMPSKESAELRVANWLQALGCKIYAKERDRVIRGAGRFSVRGINDGKSPDLLVEGVLYSKTRRVGRGYVAIEIRFGYEHQEIVQGFQQVLSHFADYCLGAEYYVEDKAIEVSAIVLATYYSPSGYIYRFEEGLPNNFVPKWPSAPLVFTLSRVMWAMRDQMEQAFRQLVILTGAGRTMVRKAPLRTLPLVGILAKNVREPNRMPYEAELLLSQQDWSWGLAGLKE